MNWANLLHRFDRLPDGLAAFVGQPLGVPAHPLGLHGVFLHGFDEARQLFDARRHLLGAGALFLCRLGEGLGAFRDGPGPFGRLARVFGHVADDVAQVLQHRADAGRQLIDRFIACDLDGRCEIARGR